MYGICSYIYHGNHWNVREYSIHGSYGNAGQDKTRLVFLLAPFFVIRYPDQDRNTTGNWTATWHVGQPPVHMGVPMVWKYPTGDQQSGPKNIQKSVINVISRFRSVLNACLRTLTLCRTAKGTPTWDPKYILNPSYSYKRHRCMVNRLRIYMI